MLSSHILAPPLGAAPVLSIVFVLWKSMIMIIRSEAEGTLFGSGVYHLLHNNCHLGKKMRLG
jgi:hypothetical protein